MQLATSQPSRNYIRLKVRKYLRQYQHLLFCRAAVLEPELAATLEDEQLGDLSYSAQYELLYQSELDTKKVIERVSPIAVLFSPCVRGHASRGDA